MRILLALLALTSSLLADSTFTSTAEDRSSLRITVYNNNRGLIEEKRTINIPKGVQNLQFEDVSAQIDPQTLIIDAKDMHILEQNYEYDLMTQQKLLRKYVGKELSIIRENKETGTADTIRAKLLSYNHSQPIFEIEGKIHLGMPGRVALDKLPENLYAKPTMNWLVQSKGGPQKVTTTYLSRGLGWSANYVLNVHKSDTKADLIGWVTLFNNSGSSFENAQLALIAGEVNQVSYSRGGSGGYSDDGMEMLLAEAPSAPMRGKPFDEYHLYTLPRTTSIMSNQTKQVQLLSTQEISVKKLYRVQANFAGKKIDGKTIQPVKVEIAFTTGKKNNIDMAIPGGVIRLYKEDEGNLVFIGEDRVSHTPKNEEIRLKTGEAFDLVCEKRVTKDERQGNKSVVTTEITLKNRKDEAVEFLYDVPTYGKWRIESTEDHKKLSAQLAQFNILVLANQDVTFSYTVTTKW